MRHRAPPPPFHTCGFERGAHCQPARVIVGLSLAPLRVRPAARQIQGEGLLQHEDAGEVRAGDLRG